MDASVGADVFLTDDAKIAKLHGEFLKDRRPTDVMAFSMGEAGEVIISLDTAARQATRRNIPLRWELTLLSLHGILHLNGYRDKKLHDWKRMRIAEFESMVKIL